MPGVSQPALPQDAPAATPSRSMTVTSTPRSWRNQAVARPTMPAPTTATRCGVWWVVGCPATVAGIGTSLETGYAVGRLSACRGQAFRPLYAADKEHCFD